MFVDNAAMKNDSGTWFLDVMVSENTFGDILTDEGSVISGSKGLLPSASTGRELFRCLNRFTVHVRIRKD